LAALGKIWRITKIFHNPSFRRITVTENDVLVPFAVLFSNNFVLLSTRTLYDPHRFERLLVDKTNPCITYATIGMAVVVLVVNFDAILLACAQAYRAHTISDEFTESK
jgi:hypothetical protein